MKHITLLSDYLDSVELKQVPDELYNRILAFVNPNNYPFPSLQPLYDNLCKDDPDEIGCILWKELNECDTIESELIQIY